MEADRIKWNRRFESEDSFLGTKASPFLRREIERIKQVAPGNKALDIACGEGRNSVFLALNGFITTGLDIADVGIDKAQRQAREKGLSIDFRRVDLDCYQIKEQYDVILNFNFLLRDLILAEVNALSPGGVLLFDTILESPQLLLTHNPDFFLRYGELERIFGSYAGDILFSEESTEGDMPTARLLFRKSAASP